MKEKVQGFTQFIEVSPGKKYLNSELPTSLDRIDGAGVDTRFLPGPRDTYVTVARNAIDALFAAQGIKGSDCAGLVVATCDLVDRRSFQSDVAAVAKSKGIHGQTAAVHYACSGFVKAVEEALKMKNADGRHVVIVTADTVNFLDWSDSKTCSPFGAGGSATTLSTDGELKVLYAKAKIIDDSNNSISLHRTPSQDAFGDWKNDRSVMKMYGKNLIRTIPGILLEDIHTALRDIGRSIDDCVAVVPHRASHVILVKLKEEMKKSGMEIPVIDKLRDGGNTGSSTIPMTLARMQQDTMKHGLYALVAGGAGSHFETGKMSHGAVIIER